MKRGEIWTAVGGGAYGRKPRPVLIVQDDRFSAIDSVTVCLLRSDPTDLPLLRVEIGADELSGLERPSRVMIDKVTTTRRAALGAQVGRVSSADMLRVERALFVFLGLAG